MTGTTVRFLNLSDLRTGDTARVLLEDLDPATAHLLGALGLNSTSTVRLCQSGDPCIIQVRATRIGLSEPVARRIRVVRHSDASAPR